MEIVIKGAGETVVRFIERKGTTLLQESIRVSGSEKVEAKRDIDLFVQTSAGEILVSPVLARQSEKQQPNNCMQTFVELSRTRILR